MSTSAEGMPPLPKPYDLQHDDSGRPQVLFTAEQMRDHERTVAQEIANMAQSMAWVHKNAAMDTTESLVAQRANQKICSALMALQDVIRKRFNLETP